MKRMLSGILYGMLLGFAVLMFVACIYLIINTAKRNNSSYAETDVVKIDETSKNDNAAYNDISAEVSSELPGSYAEIDLKYAYSILDSENKQYLYDKIEENIYSVSEEKDNNGHYRIARLRIEGEHMSEFDIREVINAYIYDNPHIFWVENLFGYAYADEDTIVEFYSVLSADECEDCIKLFNKKIDEIMSSLKSGLTEYEREKILHDKLLDGCRYKKGVESSKDGWQYFSAYGAVVTGEAVCEGYAKSMQILLSKAGIPCLTLKGESNGVSHMWNVVELNNEWYHLDPTWDDNDSDGLIIYEYFNLDNENISRTHKINADIETVLSDSEGEILNSKYNFFVPLCTSMNMNYYNKEGILIEKFDSETDKKVIHEMVDKINHEENYLPLKFGDIMKYNEYINMMFYKSPYKYYYYIDHANDMLDRKISKKNISVLKNENNSVLRIKLVTENE